MESAAWTFFWSSFVTDALFVLQIKQSGVTMITEEVQEDGITLLSSVSFCFLQ